jgi:biopolymer transport protein ExbD
MSMSLRSSRGGAMAEINVTPMADIMIVLLIIFMVMTPLIGAHDGLKLPTAANAARKPAGKDDVVVRVRHDGSVVVADDVLGSAAQAAEVLRARADPIVYLEADAGASFEDVSRLLDACRLVRVERFALVTDRLPSGRR